MGALPRTMQEPDDDWAVMVTQPPWNKLARVLVICGGAPLGLSRYRASLSGLLREIRWLSSLRKDAPFFSSPSIWYRSCLSAAPVLSSSALTSEAMISADGSSGSARY